jgi:hypothetical protein
MPSLRPYLQTPQGCLQGQPPLRLFDSHIDQAPTPPSVPAVLCLLYYPYHLVSLVRERSDSVSVDWQRL